MGRARNLDIESTAVLGVPIRDQHAKTTSAAAAVSR